jgi:DNA-binding Xre family transcriptional regulator
MAQSGIYTAGELAPRLAEHGVRLSGTQVWRLVTSKPERLNPHTLMVLCEIFDCTPNDPIERVDLPQTARFRERAAGCGRERPCYHARSDRPLCNGCYRRENIKRWKIGAWTPPTRVCSRCGVEGPAWFAGTDHPLCSPCHSQARC